MDLQDLLIQDYDNSYGLQQSLGTGWVVVKTDVEPVHSNTDKYSLILLY